MQLYIYKYESALIINTVQCHDNNIIVVCIILNITSLIKHSNWLQAYEQKILAG